MSGEKFWIIQWSILASTLMLTFAISMSYTYGKKELMVDAVKAGAEPMAAYCMLDGDSRDAAMCQTLLLKDTK